MPVQRMRLFGLLISLAALGCGVARAENPEGLISLRATHERPLERGRATLLSLSVQPGPGLRLLDEGPLVLELEGSAIDPAQRSLHRRDAIDPRAESPRFEIEVRPHREGNPALSARLVAWVCRGPRCRPVEQRIPIPLTLAPAIGRGQAPSP